MTQTMFHHAPRLLLLAGITAASLALSASTAAAIECNGAYQINSKGEFWSPYCHAEELSRVLRSQGRNISADAIRNRIGAFNDACQSAGNSGGSGCASENRRPAPPPPPPVPVLGGGDAS